MHGQEERLSLKDAEDAWELCDFLWFVYDDLLVLGLLNSFCLKIFEGIMMYYVSVIFV